MTKNTIPDEVARDIIPEGEADLYVVNSSVSNYQHAIIRQLSGALCGYVCIESTHPLAGLEVDDDSLANIEVHGGITFSKPCGIFKSNNGGVFDNLPDDSWVLGFDCAHS